MRYNEIATEASPNVELVQQDIPFAMLDASNIDPFLLDFVPREKQNRLGIELNRELVGFMTPREDHDVWRTGAIYIVPEHRNKGLATSAITKFFSSKSTGKALVEPHNHASRKAHEKAGFMITKRITIDGEEYDVLCKT